VKWIGAAAALLLGCALAQQSQSIDDELKREHANCMWFDGGRERHARDLSRASSIDQLTSQVTATLYGGAQAGVTLDFIPPGSRTNTQLQLGQMGTIDRYVFGAIQEAGVTAAERTNDFEFLRRVTLDLTGRIPKPEDVTTFVADSSANKRATTIDKLLATSEWADKWTMYFGDLLKNNSRNTQIPRYTSGVAAFNTWIRNSLTSNKPYDQWVREMISATGNNSYQQGELNFMVGGVVTGGPRTGQDIFDQQAANISSTFLGISHLNCVLCHNGRGHLDSLTLWGKSTTRLQAWEFASFLSHTAASRTPVQTGRATPYYWGVQDNTAFRLDYALNTTTGNRPARQPVGSITRVAPVYLFSGRGPNPGENYRVALGREITQDVQFARATVNYMWAEFFGKGLVEPLDGFDPARLDPDNPPPDPWTLQPSNARLLNALAQDFIESRYDLKALMRQIANSESYQLSSRYNGTWDPAWEKLYARKFVRRLWAEEIHDAVVQASGLLPSYDMATYPGVGTINWAMKLPETVNTPGNRAGSFAVTRLLDAFIRGNRDDEDRRQDGSISQALGLMNDTFVMSRIRGTGNSSLLLVKNINQTDEVLVNTLFLNVLSRYPTDAEKTASLNQLKAGNRTQAAEDLLWSLFNKVDFIFNY
jgi:uncharacterized protein DUF1549/uncharacterized protein DUF1553